MFTSILFSDTPEHFYGQLRECIQQTIKQELSTLKKDDNNVYLKKHEVCKLLQVSKPTIDSHVANGYYKKHYVGSRVFFSKLEILSYLSRSNKTV
jgi:predicted DNA-binding transcriptional regulator AlpA